MSQGQSLMAEAEKMAKGGGGLFSMFGGADYAGAVEKYKQAANQLYVFASKFKFFSLNNSFAFVVIYQSVVELRSSGTSMLAAVGVMGILSGTRCL